MKPASEVDPNVLCAKSTEQSCFNGAVAFCIYFPAVWFSGGNSLTDIRWVAAAKPRSPGHRDREAGAYEGTGTCCRLPPTKMTPSSEKSCLGVSNWAARVNGNFWPSLLRASFPHLYSGADVSSSRRNVKHVHGCLQSLCVQWRRQPENAKEEAHHLVRTAVSEAFLYKVCSYLRSGTDDKKCQVTVCTLHEATILWLVVMQTQADVSTKNKLQSSKKVKERHLSLSVCYTDVLFISSSIFFFIFFISRYRIWNMCWHLQGKGTFQYPPHLHIHPSTTHRRFASQFLHVTYDIVKNCSIFSEAKVQSASLCSLHRVRVHPLVT